MAVVADAAPDADVFTFDHATLRGIRLFVESRAIRAGLDIERAHDLALAAHEVATNSALHGGGDGMLRMWSDERAVICEVRDDGRIDLPLVGRERPPLGQEGGRGRKAR